MGLISWRDSGLPRLTLSSSFRFLSSISNPRQVFPLCSKSSRKRTMFSGSRLLILLRMASWREKARYWWDMQMTQQSNWTLAKTWNVLLKESKSHRWSTSLLVSCESQALPWRIFMATYSLVFISLHLAISLKQPLNVKYWSWYLLVLLYSTSLGFKSWSTGT